MSTQFKDHRASAGYGELLEAAFSATSDALLVLDEAHLVRRINRAAQTLSGWTEADAFGRQWSEVLRISHGQTRAGGDAPPPSLRFGEYRTTLASRSGSMRPVSVRVESVARNGSAGSGGAIVTLRVIGATRALENALLESEQRLQIALDRGQVGLWEWDCETDVLHEYGAWVGRTAHTANGGMSSGKALAEHTHPEDRESVRTALVDHFNGARLDYEVEQRLQHVDGSYDRFLVRGQTVERDADGRAVRMMGTYTNITALKAQERSLKIALENGRQGLWEWDPRARRVRFSPEWYAMFGYPPDSIRTDTDDILGIIHPDDAAPTREALIEVLKGDSDTFQIEHRFRHHDGHYIDILSRGTVLERNVDRRALRIVGTHVDVTELKITEAQLRESRRLLETVIDAFPQRVFWRDANGRYLGCNSQFAQDAGLESAADILGKTDADLPWHEIAGTVRMHDRQFLDGEIDKRVHERKVPTAVGDTWFEITKVPIRSAENAIIGVLGMLIDVTGRREREQQLQIVADALTSGRHDRLLSALTRAAANLAGASAAFVSQLGPDDTATITACHPDEAPLKNLVYDVRGTPCRDAIREHSCFIPEDIQARYPHDEMLSEWDIEGYAARALTIESGETIGLFVLLFGAAEPDEARVRAVLDIFAARATAELERERAHDELIASEARLNAAIEGGSQGIWEWEPDSDRILAFGHHFHMLGFDDPAALKTGTELRDRIHPEDVPKLAKAIQRYFRGVKPVYEMEFRLLHDDGSYRWTLTRGKATETAPDGRVLRMLGTHTDITALKESESALQRSRQLLEAALEGGEQGVWEWDPATDELLSFGGYSHTLGIDIERGVTSGVALLERLHPEDRPIMWSALRTYLKGRSALYEFEGRICDTEGVYHWVLLRGKATSRGTDGQIARMLGTFTDVSSLKHAQASSESAQKFLELIIDTVPQGIFWQDRECRYTGCNAQFAGLAEVECPTKLIGLKDEDLWWADQAEGFMHEDALLIEGEAPYLLIEWPLKTRDGTSHWFELVKVPIRDSNGAVIGMLGAIHDVSERKKAEQDAQRLALYDPLTDLPNRRYFTRRLESSLAAAQRRRSTGALLFIDLDQFKQINDTLGHAVGDSLLQAVAQRLSHVTRKEDVVARLGGDEFVVLLPDIGRDFQECAAQAQLVADKIRDSLAGQFQFDHHRFHMSPTIGISLYPDHGKSADDVLKEADTAMYSGKAAGRNTTRFFRREMEETAQQRLQMETDLRGALARDDFEIYYQPQVDRDGQIIGAEALLRWHHPERGLVPPDEFIPIAEERGLIVEIGRWVFDAAFAAFKAWDDSSSLDIGELAINVSSRQLRDEAFVKDVETLLVKHRIPPHRIVFELTESTVIEDVEATIGLMTRLRRLGICFALDDFGVGYSSLSYLKRLPIDHLKIDRSFIADIGRDRNDEVICQTIVAMAQHLGLRTIAEGVETQEQFEFLQRLRCNGYQGFLFMPPATEQAFLGHCRLGALTTQI